MEWEKIQNPSKDECNHDELSEDFQSVDEPLSLGSFGYNSEHDRRQRSEESHP